MREFRGKQALVTGAASGIGRALAVALADAGTDLWLLDVDARRLIKVLEEVRERGVRARPLLADLTRREDIDFAADTILASPEGLDLLINNAGIAYYGGAHKMSSEQWDELLSINLLAPIHLTQRLLQHVRSRPDTHIVNMCSIAGLVAGGRFTAYHTSKFGLFGYTQALRAEYTRKGLGVTAICPGPVRTNLYRNCETVDGKGAPEPPRWLCATPEQVARVTLQAIRRNRRLALVTPLAHAIYQFHRFFPGIIDFANTVSHRMLPWYKGKPLAAPLSASATETSVVAERAAQDWTGPQPGDILSFTETELGAEDRDDLIEVETRSAAA